jgi:hypothetical protein
MSKNARREAAIKREKRKKVITLAICVLVVAAIAVSLALLAYRQSLERVYSDEQQTVILRDDGTFTAKLMHDITKNGTYTTSPDESSDGATTVSFTEGGATADGSLANDILTIPADWDSEHGHNLGLNLIRGQSQTTTESVE